MRPERACVRVHLCRDLRARLRGVRPRKEAARRDRAQAETQTEHKLHPVLLLPPLSLSRSSPSRPHHAKLSPTETRASPSLGETFIQRRYAAEENCHQIRSPGRACAPRRWGSRHRRFHIYAIRFTLAIRRRGDDYRAGLEVIDCERVEIVDVA